MFIDIYEFLTVFNDYKVLFWCWASYTKKTIKCFINHLAMAVCSELRLQSQFSVFNSLKL
jgi:hypothetical protein